MLEKKRDILKTISVFMVILALAACGSVEEKKMKFFDKGKALFEKGEYIKARLEFKNALQIDPKFAEAYYMLGRVQMKTKNPKEAFGAFSKAVSLNPDLLEAQISLGRILFAAKQIEEAKEKAELVLEKKPGDTEALLLKGACLIASGKATEGEAILNAVMAEHPRMPEPYMMLAKLYMDKGDPAKSAELLRSVLEMDPKNIRARTLLAQIAEKQKDLKTAESHYRKLVETGGDPFKLLLSQFYARNKEDAKAEDILTELIKAHPKEISYRLALAAFLKSKGQRQAMVEVLERCIKENPEAYRPCEMLALAYAEEGRYDAALEVMDGFMKRVKTGPEFLQAKLIKATVYFKDKQMESALKLVQEVLDENPRDVKAHALKADIKATTGDYAQAISDYRYVLDEEPGNVRVAMNLARAHIKNNEPLLAEQTYKRFVEQNPSVIEARLELADFYADKGKPDLAKEMLEAVLKVDPNNRRALSGMGNLAMRRKDLPAAQRYVDRLSTTEPDAANTYYQKGLLKLAENKPFEAADLFEKALNLNPDFEGALFRLLTILMKENGLESAIERCRQQIAQRPNNYRYYVLLGRLYGNQKDYAKATQSFEKALELNPDSQDALFGLARVEQAMGSIDGAISKYEALLEKNPKNLVFATIIGILYEEKGEFKKAVAMYERVLAQKPDSPVAGNNLAFYYVEHDPTEEGIKKAERIITPLLKKYKDSPQIVDTQAWLYYRKGEFEKGRDLLLKMDEKTRQVPVVNYHLGMIYSRLGQDEKAKQYLELALETGSDFPGRDVAEKTLKGL